MRVMRYFCLLIILAAALAFAQAPKNPPPVKGEPTKTLSGLEYWDVKVGTGKVAKACSDVTVNYTGWLARQYSAGARLDGRSGAPRRWRLSPRTSVARSET